MAAYSVLAVALLLNFREIQQLALATHPDKNPNNEEATQQFQRISEAYHVLESHFDKSTHEDGYTGPFGAYDDEEDDGDGDFVGGFFLDLEDLQFYLSVVCYLLLEIALLILA